MDLRNQVYAHVLRMDMAFFGRTKTGVLVARLTSDIESLQVFATEGVISVVGSTLMVTGVSVALFVIDPFLATIVMLLMPILVAISVHFGRRSGHAYRRGAQPGGEGVGRPPGEHIRSFGKSRPMPRNFARKSVSRR